MQHQPEHWQRLTGDTEIERQYRRLGGRIAFLMALERGDETVGDGGDDRPEPSRNTITAQHVHLQACIRLVMRVLTDGLLAVVEARPWFGDELTLTQVVLVKGLDNPDTVGYGGPN